jgi:L-rhamnose isomerase
VLFSDELKAVMEEVVRSGHMNSVHIALDFFDATIHRVGAWAIGARSTLKALLWALLQPNQRLKSFEEEDALTQRLTLMETMKTMPFGAVWNEHCRRQNTPADMELIQEIESYEKRVTSKRL